MLIEVFQDTVCPWCRIGKAHLKLALERWQDVPVEVKYRSFFLNPDIPPEGYEFRSYMISKGGGKIRLEDFFDAPRKMGMQAGLIFNFEAIERAPNSELSHQLIALAPEKQREAVIDAVYTAYFELGQDIGDLQVLLRIAGDQGLDSDSLSEQLLSGAARDQVLADARWARKNGISGVPFFVINQKYAFSGAQPPEVILEMLMQVVENGE